MLNGIIPKGKRRKALADALAISYSIFKTLDYIGKRCGKKHYPENKDILLDPFGSHFGSIFGFVFSSCKIEMSFRQNKEASSCSVELH